MPNTNEQRLRSSLCERVIHREATKTEGLVYIDVLFTCHKKYTNFKIARLIGSCASQKEV